MTAKKGGGSSSSKGSDWRNAKNGQYVTPAFGKSHKSTTVKEARKK